MNKNYSETEVMPVSGFEHVSIKGSLCSAKIFVTQGEQEGLTIEAPPEYLQRLTSEVKDGKLRVRLQGSWLKELEDALSTCLNKPPIAFTLKVRQLASLEVQCAHIIHATRLDTPHLQVRLKGVGDFKLDWLTAKTLDVHHSGSGLMQVAGRVEQQNIVLDGVGSYIAPGLDSQRATVRISGVGLARIQVSQSLDAWLRGVGTLEYSGNPSVRTQISGPGQVVHVANASKQVV